MPTEGQFTTEVLHRDLVAVDRAATAGVKEFRPDDVPDAARGRLYSHLLSRGWVQPGPDTTITGAGQLRLPPRLTYEGRRVLAALEQGEILSSVPHPETAEEAWTELIHSLGHLTKAAVEALKSRSQLRRWGIDGGSASITRALQQAHRANLQWSADHGTFVLEFPPPPERLFIDQIDEFERARTVSPRDVAPLLTNGRVDLLEDDVQTSLERILGETFHMTDHGGEECDLFSTHVSVSGRRVPTAFLLKGRGVRSAELQISNCGHNGDQIVRLLQAPADLFVI